MLSVKLILDTDIINFKNSVMTFYRIRNSNLRKLEKRIKLFTKENKYVIIGVE